MKQFIFLFAFAGFLSCQDAKVQSQLAESLATIDSLKTALAEASQPVPVEEPGFIHSVFVWLKDDLSEETIQKFEEDMYALKRIPSIANCYIGPPAGTPRGRCRSCH